MAIHLKDGQIWFKGIIKRDGSEEPFCEHRITDAILKAGVKTGFTSRKAARDITKQVIAKLKMRHGGPTLDIELVQDTIEESLMDNGLYTTAKEYIVHREDRKRIRDIDKGLMNKYFEITFKSSDESDVKRENANVNGDTAMGTMLKYGSEGAKLFYQRYLIDSNSGAAHRSGDIHIHDLDFFGLTTTCNQIDLEKLFTGGFSTGHGSIREPGEIRSYAALACIVIQANQNDQHGGQSIPAFDHYLAPGVAKTFIKEVRRIVGIKYRITREELIDLYDRLKNYRNENRLIINDDGLSFVQRELKETIRGITEADINLIINKAIDATDYETYQAMEAVIHNLNSMHSRAGAQVPFSSINYGTDASREGRIVTKNILYATYDGLGDGETPIFPIQIFKVKGGVNLDEKDINYDLFKLACQVSAKRMYPNFSFLDAPYNAKYYQEGRPETEVVYMGCRTRVIGNVYDPDNEVVTGRGNLSFTSINLPRLAILAGRGNVDRFFSLLDSKLKLVTEQLKKRLDIQSRKKVKNFPFLMGQGLWLGSDKLGEEDTLEDVLRHGTLSVGMIGLAETLVGLLGVHHGESEEAQQLGLKIVGHMREYLDRESQREKLNYTLLATPAEGLSGRFVGLDRENFGVIEGITDKEYYTNSFHLPVGFKVSAFEKLDIEAPYHELTNAGHISYVEMDGDPTKNLDAFIEVIKHMREVGIGYGAINHPIDRDPTCGYTGIIDEVCPRCGRRADDSIQRIRRITGYLAGATSRFNDAKKAEVRDRVKHL